MPPWVTKRDRQASARVDAAWWDYLEGQERAAYREDAQRTAAKRRANPHNRADKSARRPGAAKTSGRRATAIGVLPGATAPTRSRSPGGAGGSAPDRPGLAELIDLEQLTRTSGTNPTSGGSMASGDSYGGLKARIIGIAERTKEAQGPLQAAQQEIEGQIAEALSANEDSQAMDETINALMQAKEHCEQAQQMLGLAGDSASSAAAELK